VSPFAMFFWLLVGHAVCDYPLQGDFLARAKSHRNPVRAANGQAFPWPVALMAHAIMHAGAVALVTGSVALGVVEYGLHIATDYATDEGWTGGYWGDQAAHVGAKALILVLFAAGIR
jgi:hypothetical protein